MESKDIQSYLTTKLFGRNLIYLSTVDSTNQKAKLLIKEGVVSGTVVIADEQTAGRGRLNRNWLSEPGKNLLFSVIIKPTIANEQIGVISLYAGLAVAKAIEEALQIKPVCKWPNDLLLGEKKFCGILSEAIFEDNELVGVVVGIGINVNQLNFPEEIREKATSLQRELGKEINRFELLNFVLNKMEYYYNKIQKGSINLIIKEWVHYTKMFGQNISVKQNKEEIRGIALRLAEDGGLIISTAKGELKVLAGDVTICS